MVKGKTKLEFGMNIHNSAYQSYPAFDLEKNIESCKELGLDTVRFNRSCSVGDVNAIKEVEKVSALCHSKGMKLMLVDDGRAFASIESLDEIEMKMAEHYKYVSATLRDKVDYYQIYNELDVHCMGGNIANIFLTPKDGKEKGEYDCVLWERSVAAVKGAIKGMKDGYPEGKICINFAWWHTALIYELYNQGLRWDITGIDWYSDCEEVSSIELLMNDVLEHIPNCDIMICETNFWMNLHDRYSEERKQLLKKSDNRNKWQAEWVPEFIDTLIKINNPRLKAVIFYELLDEPNFEKSKGSYHGESHFGFIECDVNGANQVRKPAFYSLQKKIKEIKK